MERGSLRLSDWRLFMTSPRRQSWTPHPEANWRNSPAWIRVESEGTVKRTFTRAIGIACDKIIRLIVRGLALSKIHPNVLTFLGLLINIAAAVLLAAGRFRAAGF